VELTENQTNRVWQLMIEAEVRSYYFGDLASSFTKRKQLVTGLSFFLSSGAAATLAAKLFWAPLAMAIAAAVLSAWSIAVELDKRAAAMAQLHYQWNVLSADYERLWHRWFEEDAEEKLNEFLRREQELSKAGTEAPYKEALIEKWQHRVNGLRGLSA